MSHDTRTRAQIAALIFTMTNAVLFGIGLIAVLSVPALNAYAGLGIAVVVTLSFLVAAPVAWIIAPRLRARFWRRQTAVDIVRPEPFHAEPRAH